MFLIDKFFSLYIFHIFEFNNSRVEIRDSTLLFRQIEVEDAGKYECFAMNIIANATAIAEVIVNGKIFRPLTLWPENKMHVVTQSTS